jgi:putative ABC transport system permease protein
MFVLGVALGVAMIVSIDVANSSALRSFGLFTETIAGHTTHQIFGGPEGLPEDIYRHLKVDLGVRDAAPVVNAYVRVVDLDNQPLQVFGVDPFAEAPFRGYLKFGVDANANTDTLTNFLTKPNQVLISDALAAQYHRKTGDSLVLQYGPHTVTVTIAGLLRSNDDVSGQSLQGMLITDISTAQELLGMVGHLSEIDLIIPDGAPGETLLNTLRVDLPPGARIEVAAAKTQTITQLTASFQLSLTALSLLALVVGMFLIYNTVTFSVVQRRPMIGTLRALGVTRSQVFSMILWEAALLSILGGMLGLGAGVIMGRLAVILVTQTVSNLYFTIAVRSVSIPPLTLVKGVVIGVGAALFAAIVPAYEATTTPPAGTLKRSDIESKVRSAIPLATGLGLAIVLASVVALSVQQSEIVFAGLFGIVIGFSLFTPLVALVLMNAVRPAFGTIFGVLGRMAPRSILRSLSRTSVAVAALMVAVSVIVGVSAMVGSFRNNVQDWLETTIRTDIVITPPSIAANRQETPVDPAVVDVVKGFPQVDEIITGRDVTVSRPGDPLPVLLSAANADVSHGHRRYIWAIGTGEQVWDAMTNGAIIMSEAFARKHNVPIGAGQSITLHTDHGDRAYPVAGVIYDYSSDQGSLLMRDNVYRASWDDQAIGTLGIYVKSGTDIPALMNDLRAAFAGKQNLRVESNAELLHGVLVIFDQTFAITTALNLLATIVAFIGILSALMALQLERTREIGTMRANGLTRLQLFGMTLIETGLMGGIAGVMAVPVGTALAWILVYIINVRSFGWSMQLQLRPEFYLQALAVALTAALLAGLYPAFRMGQIEPARALRSE